MAGEVIYPSTLQRLSAEELNARLAAGPKEAARWVYAAAVNGYVKAQVSWGQMLLDGHGTARDPAAALRWFRIAAGAGDPDGANMVGRCFDLGWGVPADPAEAARWFGAAADKGHAWAQFNLAMLALNGRGVPYDPRRGLSLLVRAARQGNPKAMNMIGRLREAGVAARAKPAAALRWYRRAAEGGCFRGRFHLGRLLADAGDAAEAARWFDASVDCAPADFCRDVAPLLLASHDALVRAAGRRALARAAQDGQPQDLHAYGQALASGAGGPADLDQALAVLEQARQKGHPEAAAALREVRRARRKARWSRTALAAAARAALSRRRAPV